MRVDGRRRGSQLHGLHCRARRWCLGSGIGLRLCLDVLVLGFAIEGERARRALLSGEQSEEHRGHCRVTIVGNKRERERVLNARSSLEAKGRGSSGTPEASYICRRMIEGPDDDANHCSFVTMSLTMHAHHTLPSHARTAQCTPPLHGIPSCFTGTGGTDIILSNKRKLKHSGCVLIRTNKLIQNPPDDTRQVVRIVLVCSLVNGEEIERRRTVVSRVGAEGCETLTITIPIPIAVSWKKNWEK